MHWVYIKHDGILFGLVQVSCLCLHCLMLQGKISTAHLLCPPLPLPSSSPLVWDQLQSLEGHQIVTLTAPAIVYAHKYHADTNTYTQYLSKSTPVCTSFTQQDITCIYSFTVTDLQLKTPYLCFCSLSVQSLSEIGRFTLDEHTLFWLARFGGGYVNKQ